MTTTTKIKTAAEIEQMRAGGRILARVLKHLSRQIKPGQTTRELADLAEQELERLGGKAAFAGYRGFPDAICISANDQIVHGIPGRRRIEEGDLVGLDFGVIYGGMITDAAVTVGVGQISPEAKRLLTGTREALKAGIKAARAGARVGDISHAVEQRLHRSDLGVVEDLIGHAVGHELHEEPGIPNYGRPGTGPILRAGMTLAIEPMATLGGPDIVLATDGWTVSTADGSLAAHFEHTVLVTDSGGEILTEI